MPSEQTTRPDASTIARSLTASGRELVLAMSSEWKALPMEQQLRIKELPAGLVSYMPMLASDRLTQLGLEVRSIIAKEAARG